MDNQNILNEVIERIKASNNILIAVNQNPSVDQLAGAIGLAVTLNNIEKHVCAVFSGQIPSLLEFLEPSKTLEPNTDSLRDFIISLDKSKADKLRYKVEDDVVKVYITPYKRAITSQDLVFSEGEVNVDTVIALGVTKQDQFDNALASHGRILHNATVIGIDVSSETADFGAVNFHDPNASSVSEMVANFLMQFSPDAIDPSAATALLTGIVATTDRYSNERTTPGAMIASAKLIANGADQRLIAANLTNAVSAQPEAVDAGEFAPPELSQISTDTPAQSDIQQLLQDDATTSTPESSEQQLPKPTLSELENNLAGIVPQPEQQDNSASTEGSVTPAEPNSDTLLNNNTSTDSSVAPEAVVASPEPQPQPQKTASTELPITDINSLQLPGQESEASTEQEEFDQIRIDESGHLEHAAENEEVTPLTTGGLDLSSLGITGLNNNASTPPASMPSEPSEVEGNSSNISFADSINNTINGEAQVSITTEGQPNAVVAQPNLGDNIAQIQNQTVDLGSGVVVNDHAGMTSSDNPPPTPPPISGFGN